MDDRQEPKVRWTTYNEAADSYQGSLMFKETYAKRFLELRVRDPSYDFSKIQAVLDHLFVTCVSMAANSKLAEIGLELEDAREESRASRW